nr:MAG TPA: hypothetical protein [Caudoviricetes sp.]
MRIIKVYIFIILYKRARFVFKDSGGDMYGYEEHFKKCQDRR